jgi:hypothetical protein
MGFPVSRLFSIEPDRYLLPEISPPGIEDRWKRTGISGKALIVSNFVNEHRFSGIIVYVFITFSDGFFDRFHTAPPTMKLSRYSL